MIVGLAFGGAEVICGDCDVDPVEAPGGVRRYQELLQRSGWRGRELDQTSGPGQQGIPGPDNLVVVNLGRDAAHAGDTEDERHLVLTA